MRSRNGRRWLSCLAIALGTAACGGGGSGTGPGPGDDGWLYPLTVPTDVAIVDLDGDGRRDVLTLEMRDTGQANRQGRLLVYRQAANGTFAAPEVTLFGTYPWHFAIGDLDGDGAPDVVATDPEASTTWVLWQDAAQRGRFEPAIALVSETRAYDAAIGDFNGDGVPDVAVPGTTASRAVVRLMYQDPARRGNFLPPVDVPAPGPSPHVVAGDLDRDGRTDLVTQALVGGGGATAPVIEIGLRLQLADGSLGPWRPIASHTGLNVVRMQVADYEGDGANDLFVYLTPWNTPYDATLSIVRQDALPGTFLAAANTRLPDTRGLNDAAFADLNRDGRPDAVVAGFFPVGSPSVVKARINLFTQSGGGLFAPTTLYEPSIAVANVTVGDLNGDGATDLVAFAGEAGCVVMLQSPTTPGLFPPPEPLR